MVLTGIWVAAFAASAIAGALVIGYAHAAIVPLIAIQVLAFVIPFVCTNRYSEHAKAAANLPTPDPAT